MPLANPNPWSENWERLYAFIRDWFQIDFVCETHVHEIAKLEQGCKIKLPPSAKEWCNFALSSRLLKQFSWRDCLAVERVKNTDAYSLLIQGEADYYWAIQSKDLMNDDPPVMGYFLNYDSEDSKFETAGMWAPSVSAFAMDYFLSYMKSPGGGFSTRQSSENFDRMKLIEDVGEPTCFGHLELFRTDDVLVILGGLPPSWRYGSVDVELQRKISPKRLPPSVQRLLSDAFVKRS